MLEFWLDMARNPPVVGNDVFFRSLGTVLRRLAGSEAVRSFGRRKREARTLVRLVKKHSFWQSSGRFAALFEYLLTARFDSISTLLDGIKTTHLFSTHPARARLADALGGYTLANPHCRLAINAVDVQSGRAIRFVSHAPAKHGDADQSHYRVGPITVEMVLASAAIPILFDPVEVQGMTLWDGGVLVNTPLAPTVALGARRILPVLVSEGEAHKPPKPRTLGAAIERLADAFLENAYNTDRKLLRERNRVAALRPAQSLALIDLYEPIRPESADLFNAGSYLYFEPSAIQAMYEAGRSAAAAWLDDGPRLDVDARRISEEMRGQTTPLQQRDAG